VFSRPTIAKEEDQ